MVDFEAVPARRNHLNEKGIPLSHLAHVVGCGRQMVALWGRIVCLIRGRLAWLTMASFWGEAYQSFRRTGGFVFTFLGFCASVWAIYAPAPFAVDVRWLLGVAIVAYIMTAASIDLAARALAQVNVKPKIVAGAVIAGRYQLILDPHRSFSHDSIVSIFNVEGDFEVSIGWGRVISVQDGGRLQVVVEDTNGQDELWGRICKPDKVLMTTLVVKTAVPSTLLQPQQLGS